MSSQHAGQNDPRELLEVLNADGKSTGRARTRAQIHLDGDWHRAFQCWIVRAGGSEIVLQRRALEKDTFPGFWDCAAAGHWRFGETAREAAREVQEELGVDVAFEQLTWRYRWATNRAHPNGLVDREHQEVYRLALDWPLLSYRPSPAEVLALAAFPTAGLLEVARGKASAVMASEAVRVHASGTLTHSEIELLTPATFVPYEADRLLRLLE